MASEGARYQVRVGKGVSGENEGFDAGAQRLKTDAIEIFL
jgi:hypothetical protein